MSADASEPSSLADAIRYDDVDAVQRMLERGEDPNSTLAADYELQPGGDLIGHVQAQYMTTTSVSFSLRPPFIKIQHSQPSEVRSDNEPTTPVLTYAVAHGYTEIARLLLQAGADVNASDIHGQTALIAAAWDGNAELVEDLLRYHPDLTAADHTGRTALQWAIAEGYDEVVSLLKQAGATR